MKYRPVLTSKNCDISLRRFYRSILYWADPTRHRLNKKRSDKKHQAARRAYDKLRRPQRRIYMRKYYHIRPEIFAKDRAFRRTRMKVHSVKEQFKIDQIYRRAAFLRKWFDVVVDHKLPLCKGGKHIANNLQIIYSTENCRKGSRLDYTPSIVFV